MNEVTTMSPRPSSATTANISRPGDSTPPDAAGQPADAAPGAPRARAAAGPPTGLKARLLKPRTGGLLVLAVVVAVLPAFLENAFHYDVAIQIGFNAIVAVGLNLLIGYCGQISLGHAGFLGIGAYFSAITVTNLGWPPTGVSGGCSRGGRAAGLCHRSPHPAAEGALSGHGDLGHRADHLHHPEPGSPVDGRS